MAKMKKAKIRVEQKASYYAVGATDYMGPFDGEDEAYEAYLRDHKVEPSQILLGIQTGKAIEGQVVWESDAEDED